MESGLSYTRYFSLYEHPGILVHPFRGPKFIAALAIENVSGFVSRSLFIGVTYPPLDEVLVRM